MSVGLLWDLIAKDNASPAFLRVAGAADKAATATERATRRISATSARMAKTGATLTKSLTLPIIAATGVAVDQAVKYQKSLTLIQTAGGETAKKTAAISKGMMRLARTTGQSLDDLSQGIYTVAKAGAKKWSATQQLTVLKAAAQSATTEHVDLGTAVSALTSVMQGYGISAGKAVTAENEIIRASGLSKTSMQDFAGSLANVVPLASSLHISFAQIGGAIATMTQHGETADRATQNLSNLITNLAGQNNVASAAMQQLGLNTVKLQKNLAKNGLTGTLQKVEDKIAGSSKAGMVVVSAFKQAQNATHDLGIELGHMTGQLATNSKAFVSGKLGYKDYLTFVKTLGGKQYQLGRGLISTVAAAKGFNTQLTSGNAAVRTQATELQKLLGGVTGMRTALMLGGTSAKQFANNTKEIGKAALHAGADVLGWNKTSDTLAVKMANAGHSLQVLGVEIGTALIPAVSKIVAWVQDAVTWIGNLTDTQRKVAAWSVGILAALGPVLSLGARFIQLGRVIGGVTTGISRAISTMATGSTAEITGVTRATQGLTATLAGAGIGFAIGTLTRNSSNATKAVGALGSAAAGAAIGFGVGGPLGAGIGAIAGGLTSLATSFLDAGNSGQSAGDKAAAAAERARAAIQKQKQAVGDLTQAILADNNAIGANTKANVSNALQKSGALALAQKLKLNLSDVTKAVLGNQNAQAQLNKQLGNIKPTDLAGELNASKLRLILRGEGVDLRQAAYKADQLAAAQGKLKLSARGVSQEYARYGTVLGGATHAGQANVQFIKAHVQALNNERKTGKLTDREYANQLGTLQKMMHQYKFNGDAVTAYIKHFAKLPKSVITKLLADPKNATWATKMVLAGMKLLPKTHNTDLKATDKVTGLAARLQARINAIKQGKIPSISLNTAQGLSALQTLEYRLQALHNKNITVYVHTQNSSSGRPAGAKQLAVGGTVRGPGTSKSDSVPIWASRGEEVIQEPYASRYRSVLKAMNAGRYANGGTVTTKTVGGKTVYVYGGQEYASRMAANNAKQRAGGNSQANLSSAVSSIIGSIGSSGSKFSVKDVGVNRIWSQIDKAWTVLQAKIQDGLSKNAARKYEHELNHYTNVAQKQLTNLKIRFNTHDLHAVQVAIGRTPADIRSAFKQLFTDIEHAGGTTAKISNALHNAETAMISTRKAIIADHAQIAKVRQYRSGIRSTLAGQYDITQSGSVADLISGLHGATGQNRSYTHDITLLRRRFAGSKAGLALVNKLAASGQTATLATLAGASASADLRAAHAFGGYQGSLNAGSNAGVVAHFGKSLDSYTKELRDDRHELKQQNRALATLVHTMAKVAMRPAIGGDKAVTEQINRELEAVLENLESAIRHGRN